MGVTCRGFANDPTVAQNVIQGMFVNGWSGRLWTRVALPLATLRSAGEKVVLDVQLAHRMTVDSGPGSNGKDVGVFKTVLSGTIDLVRDYTCYPHGCRYSTGGG